MCLALKYQNSFNCIKTFKVLCNNIVAYINCNCFACVKIIFAHTKLHSVMAYHTALRALLSSLLKNNFWWNIKNNVVMLSIAKPFINLVCFVLQSRIYQVRWTSSQNKYFQSLFHHYKTNNNQFCMNFCSASTQCFKEIWYYIYEVPPDLVTFFL